MTILAKGSAGSASDKMIEITSGNALRYFVRGDSGNWDVSGSSVSSLDNVWFHVAMTFSSAGDLVAGYFNGQPDGSDNGGTPGSVNDDSESSLQIGARNGTNLPFTGQIDDVLAYNRVLSASEVLALYNDSRLGHPRMLNWIRPRYYVDAGGAPPAGGFAWLPNRTTTTVVAGAVA